MDFDLSVTIRRPVSVVFALVADIQDYGEHSDATRVPVMTKVTPGPTRVGTRWHEVVRLAPFASMTIWSEVTAIEPDRRMAETFRAWWMRGTLEYTVEATPEGTVLRQRETLLPRGPFRLFDRRIARMLEPNLRQRLADIRDLLEAGGPAEAEPAAVH